MPASRAKDDLRLGVVELRRKEPQAAPLPMSPANPADALSMQWSPLKEMRPQPPPGEAAAKEALETMRVYSISEGLGVLERALLR